MPDLVNLRQLNGHQKNNGGFYNGVLTVSVAEISNDDIHIKSRLQRKGANIHLNNETVQMFLMADKPHENK